MSCPQQLKESNDIIESLKEKLTTFANNISLEDSTVSNIECYPMTDEQRYRYQCSAFLMTTVFCCFFINCYNFMFSSIHPKLLNISFVIIVTIMGVYGRLVHLCRKDIKENLTEKEKEELRKLFKTAASFNIILLIFFLFLCLSFLPLLKNRKSKFGDSNSITEAQKEYIDSLQQALDLSLAINAINEIGATFNAVLTDDYSKLKDKVDTFQIVFFIGFFIPYLAGMGMSLHILANPKKYLDSI